MGGTNSWWLSQLQNNSDVDNVFSELALVSFSANLFLLYLALTSHRRNSKSPAYGASAISTTSPQITILYTFRFSTRQVNTLTAIKRQVRRPFADTTRLLTTGQASDGWIMSFRQPKPKASRSSCHSSTTIVNRYKNSPAIFAWELANEPRCSQCPSSVITNWATSISAYIKSLDSKHMVALGDEGWFDTASIGDGSYAYSGYEE